MALFSPFGNSQYSDSATGALAVGYYVQTYIAGSSTLATTFTSASEATPNANSNTLASTVILNAAGLNPAGGFWLSSGVSYKFVIRNASGVVVETVDNITGVTSAAASNTQWVASGVAPTFVSGTSFTLAGDQTTAFHVGRRQQFTVTAGTVYGTITVSAFAALSTITVLMDGSTVLDAGLSVVNLSILTANSPAMPNIYSPRAARIDVASVAGTVNLTTASPATDDIRMTGALAITAITLAEGRVVRVLASGASTLTNNASIVTQFGRNLVGPATYTLRGLAAGVVEVLGFTPTATGYMHVRDEKSIGADGGPSVSGNQTRTLNTVVTNTIVGATLTSSKPKLPAGGYRFAGSAPAFASRHVASLRNITAGNTDALLGTSEYNTSSAQTRSFIVGRVEFTVETELDILHYIASAKLTDGLGTAGGGSGSGEVYTSMEIWKEY